MVLCWHPTEGGAVRRVVPLALVVAAVGCGGCDQAEGLTESNNYTRATVRDDGTPPRARPR